MKKSELKYLLKYCSPFSFWVVRYDDKLVKVNCPFEVTSLATIDGLLRGQTYIINEIKLSSDLKIVYVIDGLYFSYSHFDIEL